MVFPGTAKRTIIDPITSQQWTATAAFAGSELTMHTTDAPDGITAWLRGTTTSASVTHIAIPAGSTETIIRLAHHE